MVGYHALHDSHATLQRFRDGSRDAGSLSIYLRYLSRHAALQSIIGAALEKDRALKMRSGKLEGPAVDAPRPPNSKALGAIGVSGTGKRPREGVPDPEPQAGKLMKGEPSL